MIHSSILLFHSYCFRFLSYRYHFLSGVTPLQHRCNTVVTVLDLVIPLQLLDFACIQFSAICITSICFITFCIIHSYILFLYVPYDRYEPFSRIDSLKELHCVYPRKWFIWFIWFILYLHSKLYLAIHTQLSFVLFSILFRIVFERQLFETLDDIRFLQPISCIPCTNRSILFR